MGVLVTKTASKNQFATTVLREAGKGFDTVILTDTNGKEHVVKEYNELLYMILHGITHAIVTRNNTTVALTVGDDMPEETSEIQFNTVVLVSGDRALNELVKWGSFFYPNDARKVFIETYSGQIRYVKPSEVMNDADIISSAHVYGWICGNQLFVTMSADKVLSLHGYPSIDALNSVAFTCKYSSPYTMVLKVLPDRYFMIGDISVDGVIALLNQIKWDMTKFVDMHKCCEILCSEYEKFAMQDDYESCEIDFSKKTVSHLASDSTLQCIHGN